MRDDARVVDPYDPPSIEERTSIEVPLIQTVSGAVTNPSAAFRSAPPERYSAPRIEARDPIDVPLIGGTSTLVSAAFRTDPIAEE